MVVIMVSDLFMGEWPDITEEVHQVEEHESSSKQTRFITSFTLTLRVLNF